MNRRDFLQTASVVSAKLMWPVSKELSAQEAESASWRLFEITTRAEVLKTKGHHTPLGAGPASPEHAFSEGPFEYLPMRGWDRPNLPESTRTLALIAAEFPAGVKPVLTVANRVATRNWAVDLTSPRKPPKVNAAELQDCLQPTQFVPTDGIVQQRATEITKGTRTDLDKARAIYEWIVENTYRNPKVRGCGTGNIRFLLESGDLSGKCADLNALYVGLARAAGLPARDVYGIRVAASQRGYKSLGVSSENVTKAQHCRAEVYLSGYGWVPVDPADVRKVMLEEPPGNRPLEDEMVKQARARLFGSWEMNWMAYNYAQEVTLPGSSGPPVHFFMYPQAETAEGRLDSLDPDHFQYQITAREITSVSSRRR